MASPKVPADRRVLHALQRYTGMRIGEVVGRRWRDWDPTLEPLGSLHVHTQYDDQPLKTSSGDDTKERLVPIHPELRLILTVWYRSGSEAVYGRAPTSKDFIVPNPKHMGFRT